jgi:hypothetical protein
LPRLEEGIYTFANSRIVNVELTMRNLSNPYRMFYQCLYLETINVTIPESLKSGFISSINEYLTTLPALTSLIVNGEEVDLS